MNKPNQFLLLKERRFWPIFFTQFLGAFNDNICKSAIVILIALTAVENPGIHTNILINLAAGLFILPFFLFSATAGQIADKYEKSALVRYVKLFEIALMCFSAFAFLIHSLTLQLIGLFLLGFQATLFGPLKYSILPQQLHPQELLGGNGIIETATFIAILLGTIFGSMLIAVKPYGEALVSIAIIIVAILGWITSKSILIAPAAAPELKVKWNIITQTMKNIQYARKKPAVFLAILGISWFWLYGAFYLAQIPAFAIEVIGGNEHLVTLFMLIFSIGISVGALFCEKSFGGAIEIGLVPIGTIGLTIFGVDLFFATHNYQTIPGITVAAFLQNLQHWRIIIDMLLIGVSGALYTVPLYTLMQARSHPSYRSRIIAANNILNAVFMVVAALFASILLALKLTIPQLFLTINLINLCVGIYIYLKTPAFFFRLLTLMLLRSFYRLRITGFENIPMRGPAILVCNHVSYLDALIMYTVAPRPLRFLMDHPIYKIPGLNYFFRISHAIPVATRKQNPELLERAFDKVANALSHGQLVCIFPEGKITYNGEINEFRTGIERIIARTPVPVVPMALQGLWGSILSRDGKRFSYWIRLFRPQVRLIIGKPIPPTEVTAAKLEKIVRELRGDKK